MSNGNRITEAWRQNRFPVVIRLGKGNKLRARLPFSGDNRNFLRSIGKSKPNWIVATDDKYWELPQNWFNDFVTATLARYKSLYVIQPYNEQEKCAHSCQTATHHECQCSCMGANHGAGRDGSWFEVSDTFSTRWRGKELACRFMTAKK